MEIKTTYIGNINGISGIWCGFRPEEANISEEREVLYPRVGYFLKRISDNEELSAVWLRNGDNENNYIEIPEPVEEEE